MKLIFATGNAGKLREAREILAPSGIEVLSPFDLGLTKEQVDVEETGTTFEENAVIKVQNLWRLTGMPCFADDSGLVVDALGGAPGIYSARYASLNGSGADHNFASNIDRLLHEMQGVEDRRARFYCVVALILPQQPDSLRSISPARAVYHSGAGSPAAAGLFPRSSAHLPSKDGIVQLFSGKCEGRIATTPAGCGGFGYDPVFIPDAYPDRTLAEVDEDAKNAISHRGNALRDMLRFYSARKG